MKKSSKKTFGLLGLALVIVTTFFAASLPDINASATSSASDTIQVRVIQRAPLLELSDNTVVPKDSIVYIEPTRTINFAYYNADSLTLKVSYTPFSSVCSTTNLATIFGSLLPFPSGTTQIETILNNEVVSNKNGNGSLAINLNTGAYTLTRTDATTITGNLANYGYGSYIATIEATNDQGQSEQNIDYDFIPLWTNIDQSEESNIKITFNYDLTKIGSAKITIYDTSTKKVVKTFDITSSDLKNGYDIDLSKLDIPDGSYYLKATAYSDPDATEDLGVTFVRKFDFKNKVIEIPDIDTPDTGFFLESSSATPDNILLPSIFVFIAIVTALIVFMTRQKNLKVARGKSAKYQSVKSAKRSVKARKK